MTSEFGALFVVLGAAYFSVQGQKGGFLPAPIAALSTVPLSGPRGSLSSVFIPAGRLGTAPSRYTPSGVAEPFLWQAVAPGIPFLRSGFVPVDFVHRASRFYYLFFNYLSYYLYVLPVWYKTTLFRVTRLVLENSPESLLPVDKSLLGENCPLTALLGRGGCFWACLTRRGSLLGLLRGA